MSDQLAENGKSRHNLDICIMKNFKTPILILISLFCLTACQNNEEELVEPQVLIVDDLSFILDDLGVSQTSKIGYPWNGCHAYTVKVSIYFVEVETTFHHCCVMGACTLGEISKKNENTIFDEVEEVRVIESSSWTIDKYTVSIAEGDYDLGKDGNISNLKFKVIIQ